MAVIGHCENGLLVDHQRSISESVLGLPLSCKDSLFALFEPYFRTSDTNNSVSRKRKRKKSWKGNPTKEDKEALLYHQKVRGTILKAMENLVRSGIEKGYFFSSCEHTEQDKCTALPDKSLPSENNLIGHLISHQKEEPALLNVCGQQYVIPPQCTFLMSDASNLQPLVDHAQQNGLYNLVVVDPPWYNKSAKRGSKYSFMSLWQIKSLPIPQLLAPGALVGIWVTNKQKYLRFTKAELFPHWSVELVAEWYWIKVTKKGELVTDLDSPHKKPYEPLLIGRFQPKRDGLRMYCLNLMDRESNEDKKCTSEQREFWNESSPQMKRKRHANNESDTVCCSQDLGKMTTAADHSGSKNVQLHDILQNVTSQNPCEHRLEVLNGKQENLSDKVENSSDVDEFSKLDVNKSVCKPGTDINLRENGRETEILLHLQESAMRGYERLPYKQVICSVPCKIHSRKPPLNEIISCYIPPYSRCLEMFARNLTPRWTSWGNEVLKFQSMEYFDPLPSKEKQSKIKTLD